MSLFPHTTQNVHLVQHTHEHTPYMKQNTSLKPTNKQEQYTHIRFVVGADFLDPDVVLGVYKWLCSAVRLSDGHHACNVLEVTHIVHFDLKRNNTQKNTIYLW